MRIIHGHDYYDSALAYGRDESVIFVREKDRVISLDDSRRTPLLHPTGVSFSISSMKNKDCIDVVRDNPRIDQVQYCAVPVRVYAVGSQWNGIKFTSHNFRSHVSSSVYWWSWDPVARWLESIEHEVWKPTRRRWYQNIDISHEDYFGEQPCSNDMLEYMIKNRISVVTCVPDEFTWNRNYQYKINGDNLKQLEFYKAVDAYSMFQRIGQWVGSTLPKSGPPMVEITDDVVKAHKHGFDKWSFRKMPTS